MGFNHIDDILRYRDGNGAFAVDIARFQMELRAAQLEQQIAAEKRMWQFVQNDNREKKMADKQLFVVWQGTNGFYAKLSNGSTVIGATMQELCAAAQAETVSARIGEDVEAEEKVEMVSAMAGSSGAAKKERWSQFFK